MNLLGDGGYGLWQVWPAALPFGASEPWLAYAYQILLADEIGFLYSNLLSLEFAIRILFL